MGIHEQNYTRYEGPLRERGGWWVIAATSLRLYWSFVRTKLVLLLLWIPVLVMGFLIFMEFAVRSKLGQLSAGHAPGAGDINYFLQLQLFSLAIVLLASGCGAISDDLRFRTFQLYFSKPLARWEYAFGKFMGLFLLGSFVTVVPAFLLGGLRIALYARAAYWKTVLGHVLVGIAISIAMTMVLSAIVLGLSSLTRRTGYVVLAWIGVLLVPLILSGIVAVATGGSQASHLLSLSGNFLLVSRVLLSSKAVPVPNWAPFLILLALGAAGLGALARRVSKLEGVA